MRGNYEKNTSKAIGAVLIAGIVASGLNGMPLNNSVNQINAATVEAGTPYDGAGNYNVAVNHVIINQVYGGGNNKGAGSHGFIELYNPTDSEVDLSTWSVQYEGATGDDKNDPGWHKLDLNGSIPAHSSYLIRTKKYKDNTTPANFQVPTGDMQWDDIIINGKGVAVALMSNQTVCGDVKSEVYSFTTGSLSDDFTFVRASDSQSKTESGYDIFQKAVTKIVNTYNPAFIMET